MTNRAKHDTAAQPELEFLANHKSLLAVRVRPAEFARILGVSKQTVSAWIRDGKVTINTLDGLLDVRRAIQDVLRNTSPGRLRSRVLRQAVTDALELRQNLASAEDRAAAAEAELAEARSIIAHLEKWITAGERADGFFMHMIVGAADDLRASPTETWIAVLDDLYNAALDAADAQPDPAVASETDGWPADLELAPADGADLAAMDVESVLVLEVLDAPRATHENGGAGKG